MNRYCGTPSDWTNLVSAFLSGASFCMYPNLTILSHATVTTAKLLWAKFSKKIVPSQVIENAGSLPMAKMYYVLAIGYAFHMRAYYPWMCPNLLLRACQHTSGNK